MRYLVTGKEMKFLDKNTSECFKVPEIVLMEQAAMNFVQELFLMKKEYNKILVVAGCGNNGGDGIAIARLLNQKGVDTSVYFVESYLSTKANTSKSYDIQKKIYCSYEMNIESDVRNFNGYDLIIDGIFGVGLSRNITGEYEELITIINDIPIDKIAIDIPSGISADDGGVLGTAIKADKTITFGFGKIGLYLWPGCDYCGQVIISEMGINRASFCDKKPKYAFYENSDLTLLPKRQMHSNKGTFGKLLIVAGNKDMAGAAVLATKAAYKSGVGLVKVYTSHENKGIILSQVPEAIICTYDKSYDKKELLEAMKWADAIVVGPGLGTDSNARGIVDTVLTNATVPLVVDADAINIISEDVERLLRPHMDMIVTPHLGEMSRLTGGAVSFIQHNLIECANDFAQKYDVICVLKDFRTVTSIPFGMTYLNLSGNNGMATGGSGDILTGIIGALLAQHVSPEIAASLGVYIHGLAGDTACDERSEYGMSASDIIDGLHFVWKQVK